ncbi:DM13 domain-containing protein [Geminocystis sp. CENA526]|uniref:DM13 domain-containing protein n=1 Tax=Geminocystis sp. CENA526 TaxID=1355871 RepID=UPI003D6EBEFD
MRHITIFALSILPVLINATLLDVKAISTHELLWSKELTTQQPSYDSINNAPQLVVMKRAIFVSGEHPTSGSVSIITEKNNKYIEFGEDFKTDSGPDLFVILHKNKDVISTTKAPTHSIKEGDYIILEALKTTKGKQRYQIPSGVKLEDYKSVAIWCRRFNATFGAATLP